MLDQEQNGFCLNKSNTKAGVNLFKPIVLIDKGKTNWNFLRLY